MYKLTINVVAIVPTQYSTACDVKVNVRSNSNSYIIYSKNRIKGDFFAKFICNFLQSFWFD